jgi:hypothetical protein
MLAENTGIEISPSRRSGVERHEASGETLT